MASPPPTHPRRRRRRRCPFDVTDLTNKREVGSDAGTLWSLSSQKPGYGVKQLRDPDLETLWQSDGVQPHKINIEFAKRTAVTHVSLWMNVKRDDSYTPTKISVKAGTGWHDMTEVRYREWERAEEPYGWKHFYLRTLPSRSKKEEEDTDLFFPSLNPSSSSSSSSSSDEHEHEQEQKDEKEKEKEKIILETIQVWIVQISILANQQNGKDTHIRGCLIWGPGDAQTSVASAAPVGAGAGGGMGGTGIEIQKGEEDDDDEEGGSSEEEDQVLQNERRREERLLWRSIR